MKVRRNLLIGIDEVLDTRLGVLAHHHKDLAQDLLDSGKWRARQKDEWSHVGREAFLELYAKRDAEILTQCIMTNMVRFVREYLVGYNYETISEPMRDIPKLTFNFYPYLLDKDDRLEFLDVFHYALGREIPMQVEEVFLSLEELTPLHCSRHYTTMVMYEGLKWMNIHGEAFEQTTLADVELIVPALYLSDTNPDDPVVLNAIAEGLHPLRALEQMARNIIRLQHIDAEHFSIVGAKG